RCKAAAVKKSGRVHGDHLTGPSTYSHSNAIHRVPQISARIRRQFERLAPSPIIGGAREDDVSSLLGWFPLEIPKAPGITRMLGTERGGLPGFAEVGRNLHTRHG